MLRILGIIFASFLSKTIQLRRDKKREKRVTALPRILRYMSLRWRAARRASSWASATEEPEPISSDKRFHHGMESAGKVWGDGERFEGTVWLKMMREFICLA